MSRSLLNFELRALLVEHDIHDDSRRQVWVTCRRLPLVLALRRERQLSGAKEKNRRGGEPSFMTPSGPEQLQHAGHGVECSGRVEEKRGGDRCGE